ncbi:Uncharacterised protein [Streptococcus pneumoniae]|nr:Uncharacterised protein [Streptococcus pneumoniae]
MQIKFIDKVSNLIMLNLLYVASVVTVIDSIIFVVGKSTIDIMEPILL